MKTAFLKITALLCLSLTAGFATAAQNAPPPRMACAAAPASPLVTPNGDTIAWQRVGSPTTLAS